MQRFHFRDSQSGRKKFESDTFCANRRPRSLATMSIMRLICSLIPMISGASVEEYGETRRFRAFLYAADLLRHQEHRVVESRKRERDHSPFGGSRSGVHELTKAATPLIVVHRLESSRSSRRPPASERVLPREPLLHGQSRLNQRFQIIVDVLRGDLAGRNLAMVGPINSRMEAAGLGTLSLRALEPIMTAARVFLGVSRAENPVSQHIDSILAENPEWTVDQIMGPIRDRFLAAGLEPPSRQVVRRAAGLARAQLAVV